MARHVEKEPVDSDRGHETETHDTRHGMFRGRRDRTTDHDVERREAAHEEALREEHAHREGMAREKFGGLNWGACFFGWLVAIAMSILLTSIVGAVAAAVGEENNLTWSDADRDAGTIGIAAAIVLLAVLMIGYYAGGYVAGRMSRFDGGRQGMGVWVIGLLVTIIAVVLGIVFGDKYNILDRVDLPSIPVSGDDLGLGVIVTAVAVLLGTLLAAMAGGKIGHRYHNRVDRVVGR